MAIMQMLTMLFVTSASATTAVSANHPIGKVITLLKDLMGKVEAEGRAEEVSYSKFTYWCQTSIAEVQDAIKEEKDTIDTLQSTIEAKSKEAGLLTDAITQLEDEIKDLQAAGKSAADDSKTRNLLYLKKEADLKDTIKAMGDAIKALQDAATSTDTKLFLSQHRLAQNRVRDIFALIATVADEQEQSSLLNFVQSATTPLSPAPAPAALVQSAAAPAPIFALGDYNKHTKKYSFKSDSVTELLKTLKLKFEDELVEATKAETNAQNSFALSKNARDAAIKAAENSKKQKETDLSDAQGALKTAQADLKDEQADLKADSASLEKTKESCTMKKAEWEERSNIRKQELAAMEAATKILAKVSGVKTGEPSNPVLPTAPVKLIQAPSLLQISHAADPQARAVQLLRSTAKTYHSKVLDRLAAQISVHAPSMFSDVLNTIQKMIFRLKQEQIDEDNHKAWCDMELAKTNSSIDTKSDKSAELAAKIKEVNAKVLTLTEDIKAADKMVSDIKKFQKEATEIREAGKKENALAIKDAVDAQRAITNAMSVLTAFYKETGMITKEPWEFLQAPVKLPKDPSTWDSGYTGVADPKKAGTGVIAVLEAVSSDFAKMEANTRAQEVADAKEYDDVMKKQAIEQARRGKETEMKTAEKKRFVEKIADLTAQKKHVTDELETTEQYYKDLIPACLAGDSTYNDRKSARDAEIAALKQAQVILGNAFSAPAPAPAAAFMQRIHAHA